ncbi:hypothetical protein Tcan_12959 [Toxocara canis]|uniref:Uncharacterized protein n=1 Tax=Toxocara canis TaxID=6265 RepID=A0A0B2VBH0_TOXCA|nr:hypothetical protein Tcan_12959 [Toxocara canis]
MVSAKIRKLRDGEQIKLTSRTKDLGACKDGCRLAVVFNFAHNGDEASLHERCHKGCADSYKDDAGREACSSGCDGQPLISSGRVEVSISDKDPTFGVVRNEMDGMLSRMAGGFPMFGGEMRPMMLMGPSMMFGNEDLGDPFAAMHRQMQSEMERLRQIANHLLTMAQKPRDNSGGHMIFASRPAGHAGSAFNEVERSARVSDRKISVPEKLQRLATLTNMLDPLYEFLRQSRRRAFRHCRCLNYLIEMEVLKAERILEAFSMHGSERMVASWNCRSSMRAIAADSGEKMSADAANQKTKSANKKTEKFAVDIKTKKSAKAGPDVGNEAEDGSMIIKAQPVDTKQEHLLGYIGENPKAHEEPSWLSRLASRARRLSVLSQWLVCAALLLCLISMLSISVAILKQIKAQRYHNLRGARVVVPATFGEPLPAKKIPLESPPNATMEYPLIHDSPPPAYDQLSINKEKPTGDSS